MPFTKVEVSDLNDTFIKRIGNDWMLVTAGTPEDCNTMTVSWGQLGVLWSRPVISVFLRPERYTCEFVDREERFSVSLFQPGTHKDEMNLLGTKSGRDGDKITESGLTVVSLNGVPAFEEAQMVFVCRKLFKQEFKKECFFDPEILETYYPNEDFHYVFAGEIEEVYRKA